MDAIVTFEAFTNLSETVKSFRITDDHVALETVEAFNISLRTTGALSNRISFAGSAVIMIIDDDGLLLLHV